MSRFGYRPDIDGLRAVAVLSVVLFHADVAFLEGGFLGVDVFFVISGFLITHLIRDAVTENRFSFAEFYLRRARRLFPALFVTLALTFAVATWLFMPFHLERLGAALVSSLVWVSNIYFYSEAGYFDADAAVKPLLHTWSLSVEEQFYLLWPALVVAVVALRRHWIAPLVILAVGLASTALAEYWLNTNPSAAFFLAPARVAEFAVGALLVWVMPLQPARSWQREALLAIGLTGVVASIWWFDEHSRLPGWLALVPCLATALVIHAGQAPRLGRVLDNAAMVYVGRISYSLYLVHWPVVVFYKYQYGALGGLDKLLVIGIAFVLADALHRFVETPLRKSGSGGDRRFLIGAFAAVVLLATPSLLAWQSNGWPSRWDVPAPILDVASQRNRLRSESWDLVNDADGVNAPQFDAAGTRWLVLGDSHAKDLFNALFYNRSELEGVSLRRLPLDPRCLHALSGETVEPPLPAAAERRCRAQVERLLSLPLLGEADALLLSSRWPEQSPHTLPGAIETLRQRSDARILLLGRTPEFADVPQFALRHGRLEGLAEAISATRDETLDSLNGTLRQTAAALDVTYIDRHALVCAEPVCTIADAEGELLFYDYGHWTLAGARRFGRDLVRLPAVRALRNPSAGGS